MPLPYELVPDAPGRMVQRFLPALLVTIPGTRRSMIFLERSATILTTDSFDRLGPAVSDQ